MHVDTASGVSTAQLARMLGCSSRQIVNLIRAGKIDAQNVGAGDRRATYRILPRELRRLGLDLRDVPQTRGGER